MKKRLGVTLLTALVVGLTPVQLRAQRSNRLAALRDSLEKITDVPTLYRLQGMLPMPAVAADVGQVLQRGLIALRIYRLTGDRDDGDRARGVFAQAVERYPDVAWAHYGMALSLADAPGVRIPSPGGVLNDVVLGQSIAEILKKDPRSRARRELRRALDLDPAFGPAAVLLARLALADGGRDLGLVREARDALRATRDAGDRSPEVLRSLVDMERALGDYQAALAVADSSMEASTDAGTLYSAAIAMLLQPGREGQGARTYMKGVANLDAAAAERYYADVEPIVSPEEAAEWRANDVAGKAQWLRTFWERRAAESGVMLADRLAEHYRRLQEARARYLRSARHGAETRGTLMPPPEGAAAMFDDRGLVLLKHGEPARVIRTQAAGVRPNETWVYSRPDGATWLFNFVALRGTQDYSLVGNILDALDESVANENSKLLDRGVAGLEDRERAIVTLLEDRAPYVPDYRAGVGRVRSQLQQGASIHGTEIRSVLENAEAEYRQTARRALATDTYYPHWDHPLAYAYDLFSFRTPYGRTDLTAAFAIPAAQLAPVEAGGRTGYLVRVSVILLDTLQGRVTRKDTIQFLPSVVPPADGFVRTHVMLPVVPSTNTVHRVVVVDGAQPGAGGIYGGAVRLRDFSGGGLMVSDIVLAAPDSAGDWQRGDLRLALALPRRFAPERPFTVFYEVYNLEPDVPFHTRITVDPTDRGGIFNRLKGLLGFGPNRIDLQFDGTANPDENGVQQQVRRVASELPPGSYRMRITVTDTGTRHSATTETTFQVQS